MCVYAHTCTYYEKYCDVCVCMCSAQAVVRSGIGRNKHGLPGKDERRRGNGWSHQGFGCVSMFVCVGVWVRVWLGGGVSLDGGGWGWGYEFGCGRVGVGGCLCLAGKLAAVVPLCRCVAVPLRRCVAAAGPRSAEVAHMITHIHTHTLTHTDTHIHTQTHACTHVHAQHMLVNAVAIQK